MTGAGLVAHVVLRRGDLRVDTHLSVGPGEVVALLGPNGAGKSSVLGALAGVLALEDGRIDLAGVTLADAERGEHVPARLRHVGLVVQDYLLFPHLSVLENVAFGLRARGVGRREARERAGGWVRRMGLDGYEGRRPRELSGGQAQRVALARALIVEPRLLLLDEPLAALDAGTRPSVRAGLRRHLRAYDGCALVVTHDPLEAMVLGDRVVVVEQGQVVQEGEPGELARHPRTDYVARLVGLNLSRGHASGSVVRLTSGAELVVAHPADGPVFAAFTPTAVTLSRRRPEGSARNAWPGRAVDVERHGDLVRVTMEGALPLLADITPLAVAELEVAPGVELWASVKASEVSVYPA